MLYRPMFVDQQQLNKRTELNRTLLVPIFVCMYDDYKRIIKVRERGREWERIFVQKKQKKKYIHKTRQANILVWLAYIIERKNNRSCFLLFVICYFFLSFLLYNIIVLHIYTFFIHIYMCVSNMLITWKRMWKRENRMSCFLKL